MNRRVCISVFCLLLATLYSSPAQAQEIGFTSEDRSILFVFFDIGLFRSDDGGHNWKDLSSVLSNRIPDGSRLTKKIYPSATQAGRVVAPLLGGDATLVSYDLGDSWQVLTFPRGTYEGHSVYSMEALPDNLDHLFGFALMGFEVGLWVFSNDGGQSWYKGPSGRDLQPGFWNPIKINEANPSEFYLASSFGSSEQNQSWITRDVGRTFIEFPTPPGGVGTYKSPLNSAHLALITNGSGHHITVDGGETWKSLTLPDGLPPDFSTVVTTPEPDLFGKKGYAPVFGVRATRRDQTAYRSDDFGESWEEIGSVRIFNSAILKDVEAVNVDRYGASLFLAYNDRTTRLIHQNGVIEKMDFNIFSVSTEQQTVPERDNLSVYPSPTTGTIWISGLEPQKAGYITISDASGSVVRDNIEANGPEPLSMDLRGLNNGLYFARICSGSQSCQTQKFVLIK